MFSDIEITCTIIYCYCLQPCQHHTRPDESNNNSCAMIPRLYVSSFIATACNPAGICTRPNAFDSGSWCFPAIEHIIIHCYCLQPCQYCTRPTRLRKFTCGVHRSSISSFTATACSHANIGPGQMGIEYASWWLRARLRNITNCSACNPANMISGQFN